MANPAVLRGGQFFGNRAYQREIPGFVFHEISPEIPAAAVPKHTHEEAHFVLLLDGLYVSSARHAAEISAAPTLIYNPPGTTHRDRFHTATGRFFTISVSSNRLRFVHQHIATPEFATALTRSSLACRIARECRKWDSAAPLMTEGLCLELLASMQPSAIRPDRQPPSWLMTARDLLHDRCNEPVSIGEIAQAAAVHPIHLARTFRRFFSCSPGEYLRRCRLDRAAALLKGTREPVSSISLETGFADQSHFTKAFRAHFGTTPVQYRKQVRS